MGTLNSLNDEEEQQNELLPELRTAACRGHPVLPEVRENSAARSSHRRTSRHQPTTHPRTGPTGRHSGPTRAIPAGIHYITRHHRNQPPAAPRAKTIPHVAGRNSQGLRRPTKAPAEGVEEKPQAGLCGLLGRAYHCSVCVGHWHGRALKALGGGGAR